VKHDKVDANAKNEDGCTALFLASVAGNWDVVRELAKHIKVDVNAKGEGGRTALMMASIAGNLDVVRKLVNHSRIEVNAHDGQGFTAFYFASYHEQWDIVEALASADADVNIRGPLGNTALFWAILSGSVDTVSMLLKCEMIDVSIRNKAGSTALDVARNCQMLDIAKCLDDHICSR
jgi:ankyrin repeat protein